MANILTQMDLMLNVYILALGIRKYSGPGIRALHSCLTVPSIGHVRKVYTETLRWPAGMEVALRPRACVCEPEGRNLHGLASRVSHQDRCKETGCTTFWQLLAVARHRLTGVVETQTGPNGLRCSVSVYRADASPCKHLE